MKQLIWKERMKRFAAMFLAAVMVFMTAGEHAAMIASAQGTGNEVQDDAGGTGNDVGDNTDEPEDSVAEDGTESEAPGVGDTEPGEENKPEKEYMYQGTMNGLTWTIDSDGEFVLKGQGDYDTDPNNWQTPWGEYVQEIRNAVVDVQGITSLKNLFSGCTNLEEIDFTDSDTSKVTNMYGLFNNCTALKEVDISNINTSNVTNMSAMFQSCTQLNKVNLAGIDTTNVTNMSFMFSSCGVEEIRGFENIDTANVTNMSAMFQNCKNLTNFDLSGLDTDNVIDMSCMFNGWEGELPDFSNFDTGKVTKMQAMFQNCKNAKELDLTSFDTQNVTDMSQMFYGWEGKEIPDISSFDTKNVTNMMDMFGKCENLTNVDVSFLDFSNLKNASQMFSGCYYLKTLKLSQDFSGVQRASNLVKHCYMLEEFYTPSNVTLDIILPDVESCLYAVENGWLPYDKTAFPKDATLWEDAKGNKYTSVPLNSPESVYLSREIEIGSIEGENNSDETENDGVTWSINDAGKFTLSGSGDYKLVNQSGVLLPEWASQSDKILSAEINVTNITSLTSLFYNCKNLKQVTFNNSETSRVTNISNMFYNCPKLEVIDLSDCSFKKVSNVTNALTGCVSLKEIHTPCDLKTDIAIPGKSIWTDSEQFVYKFLPMGKNESIRLVIKNSSEIAYKGTVGDFSWMIDTNGVFSIAGSGDYMMYMPIVDDYYTVWERYASKIKTAKVNVKNVQTLDGLFKSCKNLTAVDFGDSDTSQLAGMQFMFKGCSSLKTLDLSTLDFGNVVSAYEAFEGCTSLTKIYTPRNLSETIGLPKPASTKQWRDAEGTPYTVLPIKNAESIVLTVKDIGELSGKSGDLNWEIDKNGKLTVSGDGDYKLIYNDGKNVPVWTMYADKILTADINITNCTNLGGLFYNCKNLRSFNLNNIDTSKVTDMSYMFYNCQKLENLDLSGFETSNVTNMSGMFQECKKLKTLNVSNFETSEVTKADNMFMYCFNLNTLNLSNFDFSKLEKESLASNMFVGCYGLRKIYTPKNLAATIITPAAQWAYEEDDFTGEYSKVRPDRNAKWIDDKGNGRISLPINRNDSVCLTLKVPSQKLKYVGESGNLEWSIDTAGKFVLTGTGDYTVDTLTTSMMGDHWMESAPLWYLLGSEIKTAEINVNNITNLSNLFRGCGQLTKIDWGELDTGNVTKVNGLFSSCMKLKEVDLSGFDFSKVQEGDAFFDGCDSLRTIKTPKGLKTYIWLTAVYDENWEIIGEWADESGTVITELPMNLEESKILTVKIREKVKYKGTSGKVTWTITNLGKLTLTGNGDYKLTDGKPPWTKYASQIKTADVNLTNLKSMKAMFYGCYNLSSVNFNNIDTSQVTDMSYMFYNPYLEDDVSQLREVNLSGFDTGNVTDMTAMFGGQSRLKALDLSNFDTSKVHYMKKMFWGCMGLKELNVSSFNTSNVKDMSYMFAVCGSLQKLDLTGFDTKLVKDMSYMFSSCDDLLELDLGSFDTGNVMNMERMFGDWENAKTINISALETGKVTNMRRMFESCEDLEYLDLSSFDTSKLENMSEMFSGCTDLQKLNLGGLDFSKVSNTSNVFKDCRQINEIQTPVKLQASLTLPDINGYPWVTSAGKVYSVMPQKQSKSFTIKLEDIIAVGGATYSNVWTIDKDGNLIATEGIFYKNGMPEWYPYADKIKHAEINAKYESKLDNLFAGCVNLESVNITNLDTSEAISMSGMFKGCEKLTEVDLSRMDTSLVKNMNSMFEGCISLKELNLETFDTKQLEDMSSMFKDCHNLTSVNMSSFNMDSIDIIGNPFEGCESLVKIHSPFNLWKEAELPQTEDMVWVAGNEVQTHLPMRTTDSTVLEKVSLVKKTGTDQGQNWTVYTTGEMVVEPVQMRMFAMRRNLTTNAGWADYADIIKKVVIKGDNLTDINGYLNDCSKLEKIDLSEANLNKLTDTSNVFANCTSLKVIYAPAGLERSILLPLTDGYVWEDEKGTAYTELPQGLEESVKLSLESAHVLEEISRVEATCKDEGSIVYKCKDAYCEYTETVIIPVLTTHSYDEGKVTVKATCHTAGEKLYTCTVCEAEKTVKTSKLTDHSYKKEQILKKATDVRNGEKYLVCSDCEATKTVTIPKIKSVTLSTTKYVYDGKTKTPSVTVKDNAGKTLKKDVDYKISNPSSRKSVKRYTVTVTFKGAYSGTVKKDFVITPAAPKTASAQLYGYDDVKFSWSKVSGASGYNVYYRKYSAKSYTYLGATTKTSYKKANLADGTRYAFKVVPYYYDKSNKKKYESTANKAVTIYTLKKISTPKISKSGSKVKVKWTNISGETGYQISQSTKKSKTKIVSTYKTTSGSSKTIKATKKKNYYYKVRAYKTVNGKKIYGPWSSTVKYKRK